VSFDDRFIVRLPLGWLREQMEDGRWWCGPRDRSIGVVIREAQTGVPPPSDTRLATPTGNALYEVENISTFLRTLDLVGEIEVSRIQSGRVVHARRSYVDDGEELIDLRWYTIRGTTTGIGLMIIILTVARDRYENVETRALIDHFASEAFACQITDVREPDESVAASLQDLYLGPWTAIRIPAFWRLSEKDDGWWARDPSGSPGMLYAYWNQFRVAKPVELSFEEVTRLAAGKAEEIATDMLFDDGTLVERSVIAVKFGTIARTVEDIPGEAGVEDGAPLRTYSWVYMTPMEKAILMTRYRLYLPRHLLDRSDLIELRELIDREVLAQRLLPLTGE
jgi:hypothetical protein